MVKHGFRKIGSGTVRRMTLWSHYAFRQKLKHKGEQFRMQNSWSFWTLHLQILWMLWQTSPWTWGQQSLQMSFLWMDYGQRLQCSTKHLHHECWGLHRRCLHCRGTERNQKSCPSALDWRAGGHVTAGSTKWGTGARCSSVWNIVMSADMMQGVRYFLVHTGWKMWPLSFGSSCLWQWKLPPTMKRTLQFTSVALKKKEGPGNFTLVVKPRQS